MKSLMIGFLALCLYNINAQELKMATTTSTDNTGLLDVLAPAFKKDTGIELKWVSVGTGNALKLGENCDVDVLLVHSPKAEEKYIQKGFGIDRKPVMYNDFVIIGNRRYSKLFSGKNLKEAFNTIKKDKIKFVSRGDKSGTNDREIALWKETEGNLPEKEKWYIQSGQGMLATINITDEQNAITLSDRGTYIKYLSTLKGKKPLVILVEGDDALKNFYSIIPINPKKCKNVNYKDAVLFSDWITSTKGQNIIKDFKINNYKLFTPNAKD
ncbi:tungstate ABC transporter substrate-binding protein TupA [Helicobacter sp. 13S00477-4]|uniref:tungstate ABC transporter substrate-binding protein TupA n=1 Tax=Helicobacter sp. 13S00477-4 TaxID=1905759 RepID=UPI000BDB577F|nr:tungstate ABC transporter substrate-binding protein TupA [Helicobacter sp. 13S00477-4]PAF52135.1 tungsten ABC transporter substrate-binding protein [Helicobacter sp. 13S00477-4]